MDRRDFVGMLLAVGAMARSSSPQSNPPVVIEGTLEVLIEDHDDHSRILYFLITAQQRIELRFRERAPQWTTGTLVRVRGVWQPDNVLLVSKIDRR